MKIKSILVIFFCTVLLNCGSNPDNAKANQATSSVPPLSTVSKETSGTSSDSHLSEVEKKYLGAALGYLNTVNEQDSRLAGVMAGASTGESTLGMIKDAIKRDQLVESAGFLGDYSPAAIPVVYQALDIKIKEVHRLHSDSFKEMLEYWKDSNTDHISSGNLVLKRAVLLTNECIGELNRILKSVGSK
jgi:hypothetical protein